MQTAIWIIQGVLAFVFLMTGFMKVAQPKEKIAESQGWVENFSAIQVKGIGVLELLASIGLVLPTALNILPIFTPLAAIGLVLTMIGAALTHIRSKDAVYHVVINFALIALAVFVIYGRFVIEPIV